MVTMIKAYVNQADYANITRALWPKDSIPADFEVNGAARSGGQIARRGPTSRNYPKQGFKLKFKPENLFQGRAQALDLTAGYPDKSLIRERLCFDLLAQTGVPASANWPIDFSIINSAGEVLERGLYTGFEAVDSYFFRARNRQIGALYKANGNRVNGAFVGATLQPQPDSVLRLLYAKESAQKVTATGWIAAGLQKIFGWQRLEITDNDAEDYSDLAAFIRAIQGWDGAAGSLETWLDVEAYLNWLAVNTLVQSNHAYSHNYYLHRRPADSRWEVIPWNYSLTWGCAGRNLSDDLPADSPIKCAGAMLNQLSRRVLTNAACFEQLQAKLTNLLGGLFTEDNLFPKIDAFTAEITEPAHRDARKWPTNDQFDQEAARLKDWLRRRRQFLLAELAAPVATATATVSAQAVATTRPDATITAVTVGATAPVAGDRLTFEASVKNVGSAATGATVGVAFQVDGQYITFGASGELAAGAGVTIKAVAPWTATTGAHRLTAMVDDVNRFPEISETNNTLTLDFTVAAAPPPVLSDVTVADIAFERNEAGQVWLAAQVSNVGTAPTPTVVGVAFFVDDKFATYGVADPLAVGESKAIRAVQTLALTGLHKITAIVDDVNRFPEQSEQNNSRVEMIDFGVVPPKLADTIILEVSLGVGRFIEGDALVFEASVKNIGTAATGPVVGVAFWVDGQYITFGNTSALEPGETRAVRAVSTWTATAGQRHLLAVVDDVNRYPELSESNNRFETTVEVLKREAVKLPDSTLDSLDFETDAAGKIVLTATVSNIGTAPTPDVVGVAFFVDGAFATFGTVNPMAAGTTTTVRAVQALALTGLHHITAIVDDVNRYDELSHQNNKLERDLTFHPQRPVERRAIWVTRYDWTELGKAPAPESIDALVAGIAAAGFNTVFFQVRGQGDAFYTPGLEPWAARLTGSVWATQGQNPGWDPLARLLQKAAATGLEVHAYVNAYTFWVSPPNKTYGELWPPASTPPHPFDRFTYGPGYADHPGELALGNAWRQHDTAGQPMPLAWGQPLWASPGVEQVQAHIVAVVADLVSRYAVNGIHLDLIRYANRPYSFDPASNAAAGSAKTAQRDQWQRDRVTDLVRRVRQKAQAIRPGLMISAAVWPYHKNKWGWQISTGYDDYYQDSKGWLAAGLTDAIAPMMYGSVADDFEKWQILLADFMADAAGRHVYPGISTDYDDFTAITRRIEAARAAGAPGHALFSYGPLKQRGYLEKLAAGPYAIPAVLPK